MHSEKHPGILLNGDNESTGVEGHLRGWSPDNLPGDCDNDGQWITFGAIENAILLSCSDILFLF